MKTIRYILATLMVAAIVAVVLVGCKKENEPVADSTNPNSPETQAVLDRVNAFRNQIEYYKANPAVKDGETENIDDAIWDIEALFNFTYAYPELSYSRTVSYDTTLFLPVSNGRVLMTDLTLFYGRMYETVSALYHAAELSDKQFLILDVEAGELHGNTLSVNLHTVQGSVRGIQPPVEPPVQWMGPFEEGEWWGYGYNIGNHSHTQDGDAAQLLSYWLNEILVPDAPNNYCYVYTGQITFNSTDGGHDALYYQYSNSHYPNAGSTCEFYKIIENDDDQYLTYEQLNFHYFGETELLLHRIPNHWNVPAEMVLCNATVEAFGGRNGEIIGHYTTATYAYRHQMPIKDVNKVDL